MEPFKLEQYFALHEFSAKYLMSSADAQSMSMKDLLQLANETEKCMWENLWLGYTETKGLPVLRQQIAQSFYPSCHEDNILCFAGAEEGIYSALYTLLGKGDHCIVVSPCYQSLKTIPETVCDVTLVDLDPSSGWDLDLSKIEHAIRPNTKMIVVNFPHNPTGKLISLETYQALISIAAANNLWIFCDEVYRGLQVREEDILPPMCEQYEKAISLGVVSKSLGLAGLRIGWIATKDVAALEIIANTKHYLSICNSAPSEVLALIAIRNKDLILSRNNDLIRNNLKLIEDFMTRWSSIFDWHQSSGGCTGFVRYKGIGSLSLDEFADKCVNDFGVLILPGSKFPTDQIDVSCYFRFGFGRLNFNEGLIQFERAIREILASVV